MPTPTQSSPQQSPRVARHPKRQRAGWTPERRLRQAEAIRRWQPWARSTGPRTAGGKARCRMNARKHGRHAAATLDFMKTLRQMRRLRSGMVFIVRLGWNLNWPQSRAFILDHARHGHYRNPAKTTLVFGNGLLDARGKFWPRPETCRNTM